MVSAPAFAADSTAATSTPAPAKPAMSTPATPGKSDAPAAAAPAAPAVKFPATVKTDDEKTIYALGLMLGKTLVSFHLTKHELELVKQAISRPPTTPPR